MGINLRDTHCKPGKPQQNVGNSRESHNPADKVGRKVPVPQEKLWNAHPSKVQPETGSSPAPPGILGPLLVSSK